jgi:hypothetical protein
MVKNPVRHVGKQTPASLGSRPEQEMKARAPPGSRNGWAKKRTTNVCHAAPAHPKASLLVRQAPQRGICAALLTKTVRLLCMNTYVFGIIHCCTATSLFLIESLFL